jgi:hypothetical protein
MHRDAAGKVAGVASNLRIRMLFAHVGHWR